MVLKYCALLDKSMSSSFFCFSIDFESETRLCCSCKLSMTLPQASDLLLPFFVEQA
jgi:hypothetical protein